MERHEPKIFVCQGDTDLRGSDVSVGTTGLSLSESIFHVEPEVHRGPAPPSSDITPSGGLGRNGYGV